jgi:hypothetical protein
MAARSKRTAIEPFPTHLLESAGGDDEPGSGSIGSDPPIPGSGSRGRASADRLAQGRLLKSHGAFWPPGQPLPVALSLRLDAPVMGNAMACDQVNRPTLLIRAQVADFANCWFSQAIEFADDSGNPAFWMLQKTAMDTWRLCLRRVSGELATYHFKAKKNDSFPIKLKKLSANSEFAQWPRTITISHD